MCIDIKSIQYTCNKNKYNTLKNSNNPENTCTIYQIMKINLCEADFNNSKSACHQSLVNANTVTSVTIVQSSRSDSN